MPQNLWKNLWFETKNDLLVIPDDHSKLKQWHVVMLPCYDR